MNWIITCLLLLDSAFVFKLNYYASKWPFHLFLISVVLGFRVGKKYHWSAGLAFWALLSNMIFTFAWPVNQYFYFDPAAKANLGWDSAYAAFCLIATVSVLEGVSFEKLIQLLRCIGWVGFANALYVLFETFIMNKEPFYRGGFFDNASVNACFIAFTYPLLYIDRLPKGRTWAELGKGYGLLLARILCPLAIILTHSNMAILSLTAGMMAYLYRKGWGWKKTLLPPLAMLIVGLCLFPKKFGDHNGRYYVWQKQFNYYWSHFNPLLGSGGGTFSLFAVDIQKPAVVSIFPWCHNDFLQLLFEHGLIGVICFIPFAYFVIRRSFNRSPWLFASIVAYAVSCTGDYCVHLPVHSFVLGALCAAALRNLNLSEPGEESTVSASPSGYSNR